MPPDLSVVIPIYNESPNIRQLLTELTSTLERGAAPTRSSPSTTAARDDSRRASSPRCRPRDPRLRVIRFRRNFGQTAAFAAGFAHARGRLIVTSDGDLQNDPRDIPAMVAELEERHRHRLRLAQGSQGHVRSPARCRRCSPTRSSRAATGVRLHDYGCSLKVFRAEVVKPLRLYGEMHRFLPAIASEIGVEIAEQVVNHRARRARHVEVRPRRAPSASCST